MLSESSDILLERNDKPFDDELMARYLQELYDNESRNLSGELLLYLPSEGTVPRMNYGARRKVETQNIDVDNNRALSSVIYTFLSTISNKISKFSSLFLKSNVNESNTTDDGLSSYYVPTQGTFYTRGQALVHEIYSSNDETTLEIHNVELLDSTDDAAVDMIQLLSDNLRSIDEREEELALTKETEMMAYR